MSGGRVSEMEGPPEILPPGGRWHFIRPTLSESSPTTSAAIAFVVLGACYTAFVAFYGVNSLSLDDWGFVHIVHAVHTGHLTFGLLWTQHNENRMLVPYVVMLTLAVVTNYDTKAAMYFDALLFIATFTIWLSIVSSFSRRRITGPMVIVCGLLWFSLADWQNTLWGFQLAWYLVLLCLMSLLLLLINRSTERRSTGRYVAAIAVTIVASFSSAQGLYLWPIGLLCLFWGVRSASEADLRTRRRLEIAIWVVLAMVTFVLYFHGYASHGAGFTTNFLRGNPELVLQSVLTNIGDVVPTISPLVGLHQVLGALLLVATAAVAAYSLADRRLGPRNVLPLCLLCYALLFDIAITTNRLVFGLLPSLASRYSMTNLLLPLVLIAFALTRLPKVEADPAASHLGVRRSAQYQSVWVLVLLSVAVQTGVATGYGLAEAGHSRSAELTANRLIVNYDRWPRADVPCFEYLLEVDVGKIGDWGEIQQLHEGNLTMFSAGAYETYRSEGLPSPRLCASSTLF